jgi:basic membrane protein A
MAMNRHALIPSHKLLPAVWALALFTILFPSSYAFAADFTIGFLYDSSISDAGWTQAHNQGRLYLESKIPGIKTMVAENVPESSEAQRVLEKMVAQGCHLIFTTSYGFLEPALKVAERHPDITIMQVNRTQTARNVGTYFCYLYEPLYIAGTIAGKMTKSNKLGMVGGHPTPVVLQMANAFELGARSVNPKAVLKVVWINSWSDPPMEAEAIKGLHEAGVDVIMQAMDSNSTMARTAESFGMYSVGNYVDTHELAPKGWLTGGCLNWGPLYANVAKSVLNKSWKSGITVTSMKDGAIKLATIGSEVPSALRKHALTLEAEIKDGHFVVFQGPVKDRYGRIQLASGQKPDAPWLASMNFFVEGVEGSLPKK